MILKRKIYKKMLIVDNYYFATEERAIHGRKNNTAY